MKRALLALLAAACLAGVAGVAAVSSWLEQPLNLETETVFEVRPGSSFSAVSRELAGQGIVDYPRLYSWIARLEGKAGQIHAGEYVLQPGTTPQTLLDQFTSGAVKLYSFTIVEGWNVRELVAALQQHEAIEATLALEDLSALTSSLGSEFASPEGLFLPETYRFPRGTTDREILSQAYKLLQTTLDAEWAERAPDLPLDDAYAALTLASIIEKETALADERSRIAGVFVRRLRQGMRLQTDPTVIYGLGDEFDGNLTRQHLRTDTPYNTYTRRGLPPGPIALPGRASIHAALNPAEGDELYFVATGKGDGSHAFSATREEHDRAVADYLARQRNRRNGN